MNESTKPNPTAEITIEHIELASEWALTAYYEPQPIGGTVRRYNQENWDCGTACCIWGAAHWIARGCGLVRGHYSPDDWAEGKSELHQKLAKMMYNANAIPEEFLELIAAHTAAKAGTHLIDHLEAQEVGHG